MTDVWEPRAVADREAAVAEAVVRLTRAARDRQPCAPVRDVLGATDISLAYAVQQRVVADRIAAGARVVGRKIGLTSESVQRQVGVDRPDFGVLLADMDVSALPAVPSERLLQPRVEAEIAFVLAADLDDDDLDIERVRSAVAYGVAALEIVDSRVADWDIAITDTVADNASSGLFVLGGERVELKAFEPRDVTMRLYADGELASEGNGTACLGDPLAALLWLARTAREFGDPLRAGQVVLSGALGPLVPTPPGVTVRAEMSGLGTVTATFSDAVESANSSDSSDSSDSSKEQG
ncbi:2-keto-4-pentenoate hydratase [Streptomyces sp. MBT62]|uniref:2-keto-4-pentenoate hydratase n=1 Tax=Streptomyces sp. MBT62 TaxID=2800410 RepID=UPI00190CA8F2|nr:fumarylacetoacetate hydrolase family protein [Streptomyces sp. MBT62]MBK3563039.1 fumarylacetoacetate hydrolase family protein [Streptomyces sp. MBT62]